MSLIRFTSAAALLLLTASAPAPAAPPAPATPATTPTPAAPAASSKPAGDFMPRPAPSLGPRELTFNNGRKFLGEVIAIEGRRVKLAPYDGPPFGADWTAVRSARPLSEVEILRGRAAGLEAKGEHTAAIALLEPAAKDHPELAADLDRLMGRIHDKRTGERSADMKAYREKFEDALDKQRLEEARDLARAGLARTPADPELLEDALTVDFLMHRAAGGKADAFKSAHLDKLRQVDPKSAVLSGVESEMGRSEKVQARFDKERTQKIETALARAQEFFKAYRLPEAKNVLEEALALGPPPADAKAMRELLAKVEGELAAKKADRADEERKRLADLKARNPGAPQPGQRTINSKEYDRLKAKRQERRDQSARQGKPR